MKRKKTIYNMYKIAELRNSKGIKISWEEIAKRLGYPCRVSMQEWMARNYNCEEQYIFNFSIKSKRKHNSN